LKTLDRFTRVLDWNLLKYFVQIAQSGGIGAAADSLGLSQPSISAALRRLEAQVGAQLCIRTRKGIQLTAAGEALLKDCQEIVERLAGAPAGLRSIADNLAGSVLLKTISHVFSPALDAGLVAFKSRYPTVELVLETAPWDHIVNSLLSGDSAVGVGFDETPQAELRHALLTRERLQLYCGPTHPLFGRTVDDPALLADESFVGFSDGEPQALRDFRARHGLGQRTGGIADNVYEACWLVSLGIGIGILPEPMVSQMAPDLKPLLKHSLAVELDIHLMWRPDLHDRATRLLIDTVLEHIGPPRGPDRPLL
jgi:DNA-binding transcriptional LysR family regulator